MREIKKLVMATNNAHKLREARAIAGDRLEILSLNDIGYHHDIPETADTLDGNALIKVRAIKEATGLDCFADDTGLMVDALGGGPGVYTARYAGEECNPDANIAKMLREMEGVADRNATFRTAIALTLDGEEHLFHGEVKGSIATERSGSEGFGYDPIFISEETGKCFAEMTEEEKNGISHRGRAVSAMMKWLASLCVAIFAIFTASASGSADWTLWPTFDDKIQNVFDTPEKTYFLAQAQALLPGTADNGKPLCFLYTLEKDSGEIRVYSSQNYLNNTLIRTAQYNAGKRYLLIVYDDYGIDMLYDDGSVYHIEALKNASMPYSRDIKSISFDPDRSQAFIATNFGYVCINDNKHEVAHSGIYGTPIDYMARVGDRLAIICEGELRTDAADRVHTSLSDFTPVEGWTEGTPVKLIPLADDKCIVSEKGSGSELYYSLTFSDGNPVPVRKYAGSGYKSVWSQVRDGVLLEYKDKLALISSKTGDRTLVPVQDEEFTAVRGSWDMKDVHVALPRKGFGSIRLDGNGGWSVTRQTARPNSPAAFRCEQLTYLPKFGMMVNTHGVSQNFNEHLNSNPILLSALKGGVWSPLGLPYLDEAQGGMVKNPCGFVQDPDNPDVFWFGSFMNGLVRVDLTDPSRTLQLTHPTENPGFAGHIDVHETFRSGDKGWNTSPLTSPAFDRNGNMLVMHMNTATSGNYFAELWMWTAEDRKACTSAATCRPMTKALLKGFEPLKNHVAIPVMKSAAPGLTVLMAVEKHGAPLAVYDHAGTIKDTSDDRMVMMTNLFDQDGNSVDCSNLYCAIEDPATGLFWVGGNNGVFTFNPAEALDNPSRVNRIKVSRNDGTSLADYLLNGIGVNNISIDADGRKWFSLSGGGIVVTSADGRTIIKEITIENSMLPSDMVYATAYNPENGSMMIATASGLCEYRMSGGAANSSASTVRCYPNPVRPDYYGWVTIDGLEDNSLVKITDSAGNIIRELGFASGGSVKWDVCGSGLDRVASGVYFVLASSGSDSGSFSEVSKILVVN